MIAAKPSVPAYVASVSRIGQAALRDGAVIVALDGSETDIEHEALIAMFSAARGAMRGHSLSQVHIAKLAASVAGRIRLGQPVVVSLAVANVLRFYARGAVRLDA